MTAPTRAPVDSRAGPPITVWRIGVDTPLYTADDLDGIGAEHSGGRWNRKGIRMVYAATSRALACLETLVHLASDDLPLNRYLVAIEVSLDSWAARTVFDPAPARWLGCRAGRPGVARLGHCLGDR